MGKELEHVPDIFSFLQLPSYAILSVELNFIWDSFWKKREYEKGLERVGDLRSAGIDDIFSKK